MSGEDIFRKKANMKVETQTLALL